MQARYRFMFALGGLFPALLAGHGVCAQNEANDSLTVQVPAFELPPSELLSKESIAQLKESRKFREALDADCPVGPLVTVEKVLEYRECYKNRYFPPQYAKQEKRYNVKIESARFNGVNVEIFTPGDGIAEENANRVLINVHGGAFMIGTGWAGKLESVPIAAVAKAKVVSVAYRMAPEMQFPAASEDVTAVYRALLKEYRPENIGIYGCSAGGILSAQAVAWIRKEGLPRPGAIGIFCAGAMPSGGDSFRIWTAISNAASPPAKGDKMPISYFKPTDLNNPLAFPGLDTKLLAAFPDTLVITSTRDLLLSNAVTTHSRLVAAGVDADLHVWEGMGHGFIHNADQPESREAYEVISEFFKSRLGSKPLGKPEAAAADTE